MSKCWCQRAESSRRGPDSGGTMGFGDLAVAAEGIPARVIRLWGRRGEVWLELRKEGF